MATEPTSSSDDKNLRKAKNIADRLLKIRLRSEQELREKLAAKNLLSSTIEQVILHLKDIGLINDHVFAQQWVSARLKRPFGLNRIRLELKKKGVDTGIIEASIAKTMQEYDELTIVTQLAQHRLTKYKHITREKAKQRIYGYLLRRGFQTHTIFKVIQKI